MQYDVDISAIIKDIDKIKDGNIKLQIWKKIEKVRENPYIGERKHYTLRDYYAVKINKQRIVLVYQIDEESKKIIFIKMDHHDQIYDNTY